MSSKVLTLKQEQFVMVWHETGNKSEAYRRAYHCGSMSEATINNKAYELSLNGDIRARLGALQRASAERHNVTIAEVTKMHRDAYQVAKEALNPHAMTAAANNLAKLHGLIVDKAKIETHVTAVSELSDEALDQRISELMEKVGLSVILDPQKSQQWSLSRGLQLPKEIGTAGGKVNVLLSEKAVKEGILSNAE